MRRTKHHIRHRLGELPSFKAQTPKYAGAECKRKFSQKKSRGRGTRSHSVSLHPSLVWNVFLDTGRVLVSPFQTLFSMILRKTGMS